LEDVDLAFDISHLFGGDSALIGAVIAFVSLGAVTHITSSA
jgi:hypothetical protein